jgi:biotin-(acetyl-CoA carboxylase) ligase
LTNSSSAWLIVRVPPSSIDSCTESQVALGEGERRTAVISVEPDDRGSGPGTLLVRLIIEPKRSSGLDMLPAVVAFSVAHGIRKSTGVVAWIKPPGKIIVENRVVGNAFSRMKGTMGRYPSVLLLLGLRVNCTIKSAQLGDLLSGSPWPRNALYMDPDILLEKILESFDWIYSEWERGMDGTLESRLRPVADRSSFFP